MTHLKHGGGEPIPDSDAIVWLHYTGKLISGQAFDSSEEGQPLEFRMGQGDVVHGLELGVLGLKKGAKAIIYCPS